MSSRARPATPVPSGCVILVVDDQEDNRELLTLSLEGQGHTVQTACDGREALDKLQDPASNYDLVLLDIMMPNMNGFEVLELMQADPTLNDIPVIVTSARDDTESVIKCIQLGAEDYVPKPCNPVLLKARINARLDRKKFRDLEKDYLKRIELLASTDGLTGLHNRRYFLERLEDEFGRATRYEKPLGCLLVDIDNFKGVNDTFGHLVGDSVLKAVAQCMSTTMRSSDLVARYGGEEFIALLPQTGLAGAEDQARRLLDTIASTSHSGVTDGRGITVSIGVSALDPETMKDCEALVKTADEALYHAKESGKNRVSVLQNPQD